MSHDVFISHAAADKAVADAITETLEQGGVQCWIAPRDIRPGDTWGGSIVKAIESCSVIVIVFSRNSNKSRQVLREVERAVQKDVVVLPFRLDDIEPSGDLEYFLSATHWLDALSADMNRHYGQLLNTIKSILGKESSRKEPSAVNLETSTVEELAPNEPPSELAGISSKSNEERTPEHSEPEVEVEPIEEVEELESQSQLEFAAALDEARNLEQPLHEATLLELPSGRAPRRGGGFNDNDSQSSTQASDIKFDQSFKSERRIKEREPESRMSPALIAVGTLMIGFIGWFIFSSSSSDNSFEESNLTGQSSEDSATEPEIASDGLVKQIDSTPEAKTNVVKKAIENSEPPVGETQKISTPEKVEEVVQEPVDTGPSAEELAAIAKQKAEEEARRKAEQERLAKIAAEKARKQREFNDLISKAEEGDLAGQLKLFSMYENGDEVDKNIFTATQWLMRAAENGDADSQFQLSQRYDLGLGAERSDLQAFIWLNRAAEAGQADAQTKMGDRYAKGDGVQKSDEVAVQWYLRAAEGGSIDAQKSLAAAFEFGVGTEKDLPTAKLWYEKAAGQGDNSARLYLEKLEEKLQDSAAETKSPETIND